MPWIIQDDDAPIIIKKVKREMSFVSFVLRDLMVCGISCIELSITASQLMVIKNIF